ncbi:MAG TPA: hypothetical protein VII66_02795 [Gemmatimonadaceae bacterium]
MTNPAGNFRPEDQVTQMNILLPKLCGAAAGALVATVAKVLLKKFGVNIDPPTQDLISSFLTVFLTFIGYSFTSMLTMARTNPANVASPKAIVSSSVPGKANVTSDPISAAGDKP